jgi:antitoxin Phd
VREIQLKDAKARLSAVVDEAISGNPAIITRHGKKQAVVLSFDAYERLTNIPSFGRLLGSIPEDGLELPERSKKPLRDNQF